MSRRERIAGVRFHYLIRQLMEDGWTATDIARAIGCHQTLISKWGSRHARNDRAGISDIVIQGIYDGLQVSSDYLFVKVPKDYHGLIRLKNGSTRNAYKNELDHRDFRVGTTDYLEYDPAPRIPADHALALRNILASAVKAERGARGAREKLQELLGIDPQMALLLAAEDEQ